MNEIKNRLTISATNYGRIIIRTYEYRSILNNNLPGDDFTINRNGITEYVLASRIINKNDIGKFSFPDILNFRNYVHHECGPFILTPEQHNIFIYPGFQLHSYEKSFDAIYKNDPISLSGNHYIIARAYEEKSEKLLETIVNGIKISLDKMVEKGWVEEEEETIAL